MQNSSIIRPFIAAVMLVVFAFATTPKRFLHYVVASHEDSINKLTSGKTEVSKAGFNCQIDNLVATSPFTDTDEKPEITIPVFFAFYHEVVTSPNFSSPHISLTLRGPPASLFI